MVADEHASLLHPPRSSRPEDDTTHSQSQTQAQAQARTTGERLLNENEEWNEESDKRALILCGGALSITIGLVIALSTGVVSADSLVSLAAWFEARGPDAVVLYGLFYFALELVAVPAIPLTLGSGYLFGVFEGTVVVSIASIVAAAAAFLLSRYALRESFERIARRYPKFRAMDTAIGREGFKVVFLLRLSPLLPFSISNYLYGLTSVQFSQFVTGSWLGMLPGTIAYVSAGAALSALTDISDGKPAVNKWLLGIGVVATITVLALLGRIASNALESNTDNDEDNEDEILSGNDV